MCVKTFPGGNAKHKTVLQTELKEEKHSGVYTTTVRLPDYKQVQVTGVPAKDSVDRANSFTHGLTRSQEVNY